MNRSRISALVLATLLAATAATALAAQPESFLLMAGKAGGGASAQQGYLGVGIRDCNTPDAHGAEIVAVDHDGPAGKAGLREHDIILQMNAKIVQSAELLHQMLQAMRPGKLVSLLILRDGKKQTVTATLADENQLANHAWDNHMTVPAPTEFAAFGLLGGMPPMTAAPDLEVPAVTSVVGPSYTGAMLETLSPQLADFFGATTGAGLLVRNVEVNSPAATAGIHAGDIIIRAAGYAMTAPADWMRAIHGSRGKAVPILILRDKHELNLSMTPDDKRRSSITLPFGPFFPMPLPVELIFVQPGIAIYTI